MDNHSPTLNGNLNKALSVALLLYLVFVIYGSLVPLHFVAKPLAEAITEFQQIPYLALGIRSRADWVANILLFIPLSFLVSLLILQHQRSPVANLMLSLLIWCVCSALAVGIEFTQVFFPQRTVSINDIAAESLGAAIGIVFYWFKGQQLKQFIVNVLQVRGKANLLSYLLIGYIAFFVLYNILPLDLTLSPVELFKKWREGRIVLLPFSGYNGSVIEIGYAILSDVLLWVPIAVLLLLQQVPGKTVYLRVLLLAASLEFCQLFVYSRVTDASDIVCALLACWLSLAVLQRWYRLTNKHAEINLIPKPMLTLTAAILLYAGVILLLLWYPFNFNFDWSLINARLQQAEQKVLLESLYFGTEYRAITALIQKLLLFMPLGVLFAFIYKRCPQKWQRQLTLTLALFFVVGLATLSEAMQLALPGKTVDATDILLECLGAVAGFTLLLFIHARLTLSQTPSPAHSRSSAIGNIAPSPNLGVKPVPLMWGHVTLSLIVLLAITQVPGLPYNIKELLTDNWTSLPAVGIAMYILVMPAAYPFGSFARFVVLTPFYALPQAILLFWLMYWFVPTESLHDILGSPITDWPQTELMLRFIGFISLFQFNCVAALRFISEKQKVIAAILWVTTNVLVGLFWYLFVVYFAATDNIVELLADNGSMQAIVALTCFVMLFYYAGAAVAQTMLPLKLTAFVRLVTILLVALLLGWQLIQLVTETVIVKYQQAFSALQFLLSTDRQHYLPSGQLMLRFMLAFATMIVLQSWFYIFVRVFAKHRKTLPAEL